MKLPIYLDNHSTTRVDPRVVEAMLPYFTEDYGNAASKQHSFGWKAKAAVDNARKQIAALVNGQPEEVIFTSGATESINLAIKGIAEAYASKGRHVITAATEHKAVLDVCATLERHGFTVTRLPVDKSGLIELDDLRRSFTADTVLVSIMMANNEIGTIADVERIGALCREHGVLFHTDATQAVGRIPVDVRKMSIDLMSFSAHKMYGPKGVGALFIRNSSPRLKLIQQIDGGGHEHGLRSGTLNVPGIVGFGFAAELTKKEMAIESLRMFELRNKLVDGLLSELDDVQMNGHPTQRLPHNANITFAGVEADRLMMEMKDIAVSSGSACSSASPEPSHVLSAIGLKREDILSSIRFGLGRFTTIEEIEYTIGRVVETVRAAKEKLGRLQPA
ncbi:MAG: cysteine desulfurase family protein [Bacteroidota bacterium]